jgi:hypothetical protein
MSPYTFAGWFVVATATLVAAIVVNLGQPGPASVRLENETAFPALRERPDAVDRVEIDSEGTTVTLQRRDDGTWVAPQKDGYPVDPRHVRQLIVGLSDMRLAEPKTTREDRYDRLQVEDPEAEGAKSKLVRLVAGEDEVLAEAIVGKSRGRFTGGVEGGTYIRRPGEERAWLASGRVEVKPNLHEWLKTDIMNIAGESVRRAEVRRPDAETIVLERPDPEGEYRLEGMPEGHVVEPSQASRVLSGLSFLAFDDVEPRSRFQLPAERIEAVYTTYDGVEVTAELAEIDDDTWALFSARHVAPEGQSEEDAAAARRRAEEIAVLVEGWLYKLPEHVAKRVEVPFESLYKPDGTS